MLMDLQEQTRMEDTYDKLNKIVDEIGDISVSPSLVWVCAGMSLEICTRTIMI